MITSLHQVCLSFILSSPRPLDWIQPNLSIDLLYTSKACKSSFIFCSTPSSEERSKAIYSMYFCNGVSKAHELGQHRGVEIPYPTSSTWSHFIQDMFTCPEKANTNLQFCITYLVIMMNLHVVCKQCGSWSAGFFLNRLMSSFILFLKEFICTGIYCLSTVRASLSVLSIICSIKWDK